MGGFVEARALNVVEQSKGVAPGVHLSTIHHAKGKEWSEVITANVAEGLFPVGWSSDVAEEARLFFVAMTRAKDSLLMITVSVGGDERLVQWCCIATAVQPSQLLHLPLLPGHFGCSPVVHPAVLHDEWRPDLTHRQMCAAHLMAKCSTAFWAPCASWLPLSSRGLP